MSNIGHNIAAFGDDLETVLNSDFAELAERAAALVEAATRVPDSIDDDETSGRAQDFVKQLDAHRKRAESLRVDTKEPYLNAGRLIDGFFKAQIAPVDKAKKEITARITAYLRRKEAAERAAREVEAAKARERAEREAAEAAKAAEAEALKDEAALAAAIEKEEAADAAKADAVIKATEAAASTAELSRTRGELGSLASLRTVWICDPDSINRAALDLEALRPYFTANAIEQAIRAYIRAGGRELRGARIYESKEATIR
jgi:hypothetical protein